MNRLFDETGDREMRVLFSNAETLHGNCYEDYLDESTIGEFLFRVDQLVEKLLR